MAARCSRYFLASDAEGWMDYLILLKELEATEVWVITNKEARNPLPATMSLSLENFAATESFASTYMLLIENGYMIDPKSGREGYLDILIRDGKIVEIGTNLRVQVEEIMKEKALLGEKVPKEAESCEYIDAKGMVVAARMAPLCGLQDVSEEIVALLQQYGFDLTCGYSADELYDAILSDKKRRGGNITVVLPRAIGNCVLVTLTVEELYTKLKMILG